MPCVFFAIEHITKANTISASSSNFTSFTNGIIAYNRPANNNPIFISFTLFDKQIDSGCLIEAVNVLSNEEFQILFDSLEHEITKALESFQKWFLSWLHLPLAVCQLGGNSAQSFASSFYHDLEDDKNNGITNDFGLSELLCQNSSFLEEFMQFCICDDPIYHFPTIYNFVKNHIYYIVIHQQQVEGLFNKLDLKTHANMSLSIKQSKLRLSSSKISKENLASGVKRDAKTKK
ncbi:16458_t:CDS:2 [Funneliformis caledonium]|uniref:16458_t:CDS:1 n=1 Tax=Funneliformis caledonium TaxID=1117310 RepID=A0A9N9CX50_9GLOM|nr:16458_t:CDS:2 [Funneliformis caledonium]